MKKTRLSKNKIYRNKYVAYSIMLIFGLFLGWLFFHPSHKRTVAETQISAAEEKHEHEVTIWTCAMHPQIRMDKPGKCPICGMDLIPLVQNDTTAVDPDAIKMTKEAIELANVYTTTVSASKPVKEIRLYGKVQADERLFQSQVAQFPGRIEKLTVNFTGDNVRRGQVLAEIYSPELITAQQELLETSKTKQLQPDLYEASRERLRQWKLNDNQINEIESSGKVMSNFRLLSNTSGTVISKRVNTGDYVSQGTVLFEIADLSRVWVLFDAYESDLQFLSAGKKISFTIQALPGSEFSGSVAFIDPIIDPVTRVAKVRVEAANPSGRLKPEMFATGIVSSILPQYKNSIVIPASSVLWTGKRSVVWVKEPGTAEPVFKMREVTLGPSLGESYVVTEGLSEGEQIVTNGTFSVDASAQLQGKPSMMNPTGGNTSAGSMPGMDMSSQQNQKPAGSSKLNVSMDFTMQLTTVYDRYIDLKNALVTSKPGDAATAAGAFKSALAKVDMKLISGDAHNKWMDLSNMLNKYSGTISSSKSIDDQRLAFSDLSLQLYNAVRTFGLMGKTVYYQFCPMFNNNKGAYWLSETSEIRNPYYGNKMLNCGETKETLNF